MFIVEKKNSNEKVCQHLLLLLNSILIRVLQDLTTSWMGERHLVLLFQFRCLKISIKRK